MIRLHIQPESSKALQILCLGAHADDIEIGCGGAVLQLAQQYPDCEIYWVVFSAIGARADEARRGAQLFAGPRLHGQPRLEQFQDGFMPFAGTEIKATFERLKTAVSPDLVFTHYGKDAHQDHRLVSELTWNTFRDHLILEYEVPKFDGDLGRPQVFFPLAEEQVQAKIANLMEAFGSQRSKRWFEPETFRGLMRLRGMESNAPSRYAEAFYGRKLLLR